MAAAVSAAAPPELVPGMQKGTWLGVKIGGPQKLLRRTFRFPFNTTRSPSSARLPLFWGRVQPY